MSRYLVDRVAGLSNVEVVTRAQVIGVEGDDGMLQAIRWRQGTSGKEVGRTIRYPVPIHWRRAEHGLDVRIRRNAGPAALRD
jgi:hypothetical protein